MADVQITCIRKPVHKDKHTRITHLGNKDNLWTIQEVIALIKADPKNNKFHTLEDGIRAEIEAVDDTNGNYLRTCVDGKESNNLLDLPECPVQKPYKRPPGAI